MHIFSDESGGIDCHFFVVSAVAIEDSQAKRLLKKIKKSCGIRGELKGTDLDDRQRKIAWDHLLAHEPFLAGVHWEKEGALGGWVKKEMSDPELWRHLTQEACGAVIDRFGTLPVGLTTDGVRHTKQLVDGNLKQIQEFFREQGVELRTQHDDSQRIPGLQLADLVSNTYYRALKQDCMTSLEIIKSARAIGKVVLSPVLLKSVKPPYIA